MDYNLSKLSNGLRVITVPMPSLESATVTVWVGVGSRQEEKRLGGITHFLEHMVFKGSKKRPSARLISEAVDAIGGEFNAATSKEWTNFYIRSRAAKLEIAFDVLSDMVLDPLLKPEEIEKEKGVIVEEIAMYEDTPMQNIPNLFEQLIFAGNQLGEDIIGSRESVRSFKKEDFLNYREKYYYAENIVVTVSGGVKKEEVLKLAEKYFGSLRSGKRSTFEKFSSKQKKAQLTLKSKKSEQAHFILGFLGYPSGHKDRFAEAVLASILGGGMSSRLFIEVREQRGLAYAVHVDSEHYQDTGQFGVYAGVVLSKIDEAIKVILDEIYGLRDKQKPVTEEELRKAKEYIRGHLALALENTKAVNYFFGEKELLRGKVETPEEIFEGIAKVEMEDIYKLAQKLFVPEKLNLAIIGPYKNRSKFAKLLG